MKEKNMLETAASIRRPVSLAALVVIVLYLILKMLFGLEVFAEISGDQTFHLLDKLIDYIFILALAALLMSIFSYLSGKMFRKEKPEPQESSAAVEEAPQPSSPTEAMPQENVPEPAAAPEERPSASSQVDTGGGSFIAGNVHITDGDFIGRDKIEGSSTTPQTPEKE